MESHDQALEALARLAGPEAAGAAGEELTATVERLVQAGLKRGIEQRLAASRAQHDKLADLHRQLCETAHTMGIELEVLDRALKDLESGNAAAILVEAPATGPESKSTKRPAKPLVDEGLLNDIRTSRRNIDEIPLKEAGFRGVQLLAMEAQGVTYVGGLRNWDPREVPLIPNITPSSIKRLHLLLEAMKRHSQPVLINSKHGDIGRRAVNRLKSSYNIRCAREFLLLEETQQHEREIPEDKFEAFVADLRAELAKNAIGPRERRAKAAKAGLAKASAAAETPSEG